MVDKAGDKGKKRATKRVRREGIKEKVVAKPVRFDAKIRTCDELKAVLSVRIRAHVKDAKVAKELENALMDMVAYGTGGSGGGVST